MFILNEQDLAPGTTYENTLIFGGSGSILLNEMDLHESTSNGVKTLKFKGKFQEAEAINKNKRMYPKAVLSSNVDRLLESLSNGGLVGELDHPTDSIIHFGNASHKVTKLWWENNTLMGEGVILNTPCGKVLRALIDDDVRVGISSRGVGNGKVNNEGVLVIGESYKLITFDAVADPSTNAAFQERVASSKRESVTSTPIKQEQPHEEVKNEASGIDKFTKEVVLACLGGIVQEKAKQVKARLS